MSDVDLWLDDIRNPLHFGAAGYVWVKTADEAKRLLETGRVRRASLDHDLGACDPCYEAWKARNTVEEMPNCEHFGTGYTLCLWMAETGHWPRERPRVHSMNAVGRERMRGVIARYFPGPRT